MAGKNSPTGRWFFKCIRECEFAGKVWKPGEQFVVPAGTEVPKECFQEMELLPWLPRVDSGRSGERSGTEMARKKSPTGTWFFKCIRECEFAENVWDRGEVIAVPAGRKVPAKCFEEIERLPYVSASLEMVEDAPMVSLVDGNQDCTSLDTENLQKCLPECVLTAAKGYPTSTEPCFCERILSFYRDRGPKFAFLEPSQCYMVALDNALNESGDSNTKHVYSENLLDALTGWNVKRRIWFELGLLTEYGKWRRKQVGSFEQWLASEAPHLFKSTGRPGEQLAVPDVKPEQPAAPAQETLLAKFERPKLGQKLKMEHISFIQGAGDAKTKKLISEEFQKRFGFPLSERTIQKYRGGEKG